MAEDVRFVFRLQETVKANRKRKNSSISSKGKQGKITGPHPAFYKSMATAMATVVNPNPVNNTVNNTVNNDHRSDHS